MEAFCQSCGNKFNKRRLDQIYCSGSCGSKFRYRKRGVTEEHRIKAREYRKTERGKNTLLKYENSEKGKSSRIEYMRKKRQTAEGVMQIIAHDFVRRSIRQGSIVKYPCIICNKIKSEAHHAWGYEPENRLMVVFLCRAHHYRAEHDSLFNEYCKKLRK